MERVISNQMVMYLTQNELIHPSHHAYRATHNTGTAMVHMVDTWIEALEAGQMAGICLLDMFDVVNHEENCLIWFQREGFEMGQELFIKQKAVCFC